MGKAFLISFAIVSLAVPSFAQDGLAGKGKYPQARTLSGLSGGGLGILPSGQPSPKGALSFSTPIGYTLSGYRAVMLGGNTSSNGSFRWFDGKTKVNRANGTASLMMGVPIGKGGMALSVMQTSRLPEDRIVNLQFSPAIPKGRIGMSLGVQDAFDKTVTTPDYHECARSVFVAATYDAGDGIYVSAGGGTVRFKNGFASISAPLNGDVRAMLEHDGYGWNMGASIPLAFLTVGEDRSTRASMFVGLTQGKYLTWSMAFRR